MSPRRSIGHRSSFGSSSIGHFSISSSNRFKTRSLMRNSGFRTLGSLHTPMRSRSLFSDSFGHRYRGYSGPITWVHLLIMITMTTISFIIIFIAISRFP